MRIHVAHDLDDRELALEVMHVASELGHEVIDPIDPLETVIASGPRNTDLFLAVVSRRSVNTYFQLGVAAGKGDEVLVVARHELDLAPSASTLPCLVVGEEVSSQGIAIQRALERIAVPRPRKIGLPIDIDIVDEAELRNRVAQRLTEHGVSVVAHEDSADLGGDIVARLPSGNRMIIEIKTLPPPRRISLATVQQLQSYVTAALGIERAILITTGELTRAAAEFASSENIAVVSLESFFKASSIHEIFDISRSRSKFSSPGGIENQIFGYWFAPQEQVSSSPVGSPTGAVLPLLNASIRDALELTCLNLVFVNDLWVVLSELGQQTYTHTSGMMRGEKWRFVPLPEAGYPWPTQFAATPAFSISPADVVGRYGATAAERARPDAPAMQLSLKRLRPQRVDFTQMGSGPDRDAGAYWAANVFDTTGGRYPARLMIDQLTLSEFESEIEGNYTDIIEYLYRQELNNLLERGQLRLASNVNIVLFTDDAEQARMGDIIVGNVRVKLRAIAKQLGRLRG